MDTSPPAADLPFCLVLSGGSALGAYQVGVYEVLDAAGRRPDWVSGASIGAINGALIAGNRAEDRLAHLGDFWRASPMAADQGGAVDEWRRTAAVSTTLLTGRPDLFGPRNLLMPSWPYGNAEPPSVFDTAPLGPTLARLVDWPLLNAAAPRLSVAAVDVETGEDVVFDSAHGPLTPDHIRASAALLPAFPPVEVDGRLLGDAGIAANLPLDAVLGQDGDDPLLVLAVDLLPLAAPRPRTLTEVASRLQDLNFATQSRRAIAGWHRLLAERALRPDARVRPITLIHLIYADQGREVVGKAFDYSPATIRHRADIGRRDATAVLAMLADGRIPVAREPGLHLHRIALVA